MKNTALIIILFLMIHPVLAQQVALDSSLLGTVTVTKDSRITVFGEKLALFNEYLVKSSRAVKGYRLMLLTTSDRNEAMQVRSSILQLYPEQKVYMAFQTPYIKLKFGNFVDREEADKFRKQILAQKIVTGNIYLLPETIEVKPDKKEESK